MNKYEIIGIVGEGAYGIVYKAKCKETGEFGMSALPLPIPSQLLLVIFSKSLPFHLLLLKFCGFFLANRLVRKNQFKIFCGGSGL